MFRNNGDLTFTNVRNEWGFDKPSLSNGTAYADLDNDGDMDLVINNINDYASIYRNNSEKLSENHYLKIKLNGSGLNTGGIGARIDISCGDKTYTQEFYPSRGYMSSMDHALIFGLGDAELIDKLTIIWPDLRVQTLHDLRVDQTITLDNENAKKTSLKQNLRFSPFSNPLTKTNRFITGIQRTFILILKPNH